MIFRLTLLAAGLWSCLVCASWAWNSAEMGRRLMDTAYAEARANLNKDISFRRWATDHGGVYVQVGPGQPPASWLDHVPGHDLRTADGRELTLLNPAAVLRQVMDRYAADYGVRGRITGLDFLNPANAPDAWENEQLQRFGAGLGGESWQISQIDGKPHLRYLRAMRMETGCMKCHAGAGRAVGDIIGGTGGIFPLADYVAKIDETRDNLAVTHLGFWALGLLGIIWSSRRLRLSFDARKAGEQGMRRLLAETEQARRALKSANEGMEQQIVERTSELRQANGELEAFCYSVSHDLRSPLRGIDGWSLALREDCEARLGEQGMLHLRRIRQESQRMGLLIDGMLELSRLGRAALAPLRLDLSALALSVARRLRQEAEPVRFEIAPGMTATGDRVLMEIVLQNLLENAVKFSGGHAAPLVRFYLAPAITPAGEATRAFVVEDNGVGFDPAYGEKLFGVFQRLHRAADFPGTGIGLATVKRIIVRHAGVVWARSAVGEGAKFYFTIGDMR